MKDLTIHDKHRVNHPILSQVECNKSREGFFDFYIGGKMYFVIASQNDEWQHVSVSAPSGEMPSYDVMEEVKTKFLGITSSLLSSTLRKMIMSITSKIVCICG